MTQRLDFIDVSHWQGSINFVAVKAAGILGVIMKATEGTTFVDEKYAANRAACETNGLPIATYHFLKHGAVDAQIEHYLATIEDRMVAGERVVIDYEDKD